VSNRHYLLDFIFRHMHHVVSLSIKYFVDGSFWLLRAVGLCSGTA